MRDYASKNRRPHSSLPKGFWVVGIVLITLAVSFPLASFYIKHKMTLAQKTKGDSSWEKTAALAKPIGPSQEFDFYTLLPKMAVPNNAPAEKSSK
jgi:hypothetical protein